MYKIIFINSYNILFFFNGDLLSLSFAIQIKAD